MAKPCPFCGSMSVNVVEGSSYRWRVAQCCECGATGPEVKVRTLGAGTKEEWEAEARAEALKEWNTRYNEAESGK